MRFFKIFKRSISFYEINKEIITKIWTLDEKIVHIKKKGKVHIMNFCKGNLLKGVHIEKQIFFNTGGWQKGDISLVFTKLALYFKNRRRWSFSYQRNNKLNTLNTMITEYGKVLVLNFSGMGNTFFFDPKNWWKDDIYLAFLSFPWYSRTWEIWILV